MHPTRRCRPLHTAAIATQSSSQPVSQSNHPPRPSRHSPALLHPLSSHSPLAPATSLAPHLQPFDVAPRYRDTLKVLVDTRMAKVVTWMCKRHVYTHSYLGTYYVCRLAAADEGAHTSGVVASRIVSRTYERDGKRDGGEEIEETRIPSVRIPFARRGSKSPFFRSLRPRLPDLPPQYPPCCPYDRFLHPVAVTLGTLPSPPIVGRHLIGTSAFCTWFSPFIIPPRVNPILIM